jgi:hypothetical protein
MSVTFTDKSVRVQTGTDISSIEKLIMHGDLSRLNSDQRMQYYRYRCESMGLDPMARPFDYIELQGKLTLYLNRGGSEQLRKIHKVSVVVTDKKIENDIFTVYVKAMTPDGRVEEDCGSIALKGAKGEALANLQMKTITKAKRRATISICGLGMLDEIEVESIANARLVPAPSVEPSPPSLPIGISQMEKEIKENPASVIDMSETQIPYGSLKGKKLREYTADEWRSYVMRVQEALQNEEMPQDKREEAISVITLIESYINP